MPLPGLAGRSRTGQQHPAAVAGRGAVCSSLWGLPPGSGFLGLRTVPALQSALTPQASRAERGLAARGPLGDPWTRAADSCLPASAPEGLAFPQPLPVALTPKASSGFCRLPVRDEAAPHSADLGRGPRFTCGSMGVWLGDLGGRAGAVGPGQWHGRLHAAALGAGHGATARDASVGWRVGRCWRRRPRGRLGRVCWGALAGGPGPRTRPRPEDRGPTAGPRHLLLLGLSHLPFPLLTPAAPASLGARGAVVWGADPAPSRLKRGRQHSRQAYDASHWAARGKGGQSGSASPPCGVPGGGTPLPRGPPGQHGAAGRSVSSAGGSVAPGAGPGDAGRASAPETGPGLGGGGKPAAGSCCPWENGPLSKPPPAGPRALTVLPQPAGAGGTAEAVVKGQGPPCDY